MAVLISRPCYCNRDQVMRAIDFKDSLLAREAVDRALQTTADNIEGHMQRVFYPFDGTMYWDWPNYQYAYPWRLWVDDWDIVALTALASPVGTAIPLADVILYPLNRRPGWPYTRIELDRSTTAAWGAGPTPQKSIAVTGTFGFSDGSTDPAGTLAAAVTSTTATTCTISDSSQLGAGDLIIIDTERMLVQDKTMASTGITFTGPATASAADNVLAVPDGTQFATGEVLLLDSERMLITEINANNLVLKRAWDGTILAAHTSGVIYAPRLLTVARGQLGTTAATHSNSAPVSRHRVPGMIRDLAIAETQNQVLQETGGYARTENEGAAAHPAPGIGLADKWDEAVTRYARKGRIRAI